MKEYTFDVLPEYVGGFGSVTTSAVVRMFQRAATRHSNELGYTSEWLSENNAAWMAREHHLDRRQPLPKHGTVTVRTTVEDMRRVRSLRSYEITDSDNGETTFVRGTTEWVFLNREQGTLSRIPTEMKGKFDPSAQDGPSPRRRELESPDLPEADLERTYELQFRDLDGLGHVNNVVYVGYLFETLLRAVPANVKGDALELPKEKLGLKQLSIRYLAQTHWGESLTCRVAERDSAGTFVFQLAQGDETTAEGRGVFHHRGGS